MDGYILCARTEGKSRHTIAIVSSSVHYFDLFLHSEGLPIDATRITSAHIRAFTLHLQRKRCFSDHRLTLPQERGLSSHTVNCYLRSIRAFFSWLIAEGFLENNPFDAVKLPRPTQKVVPTFSENQLKALIDAVDTRTLEGYRDLCIILTLLDAGLRVSELCTLLLQHVWLDDGMIKLRGKGDKERLVPLGKNVRRALWHYLQRYRPEPLNPRWNFLFLTHDGRPLTKDRVDKILKRYGVKAHITGVRCSPHTLRHTAALRFLRNGGDVFSLQRLLGHSTLEMTRHYCQIADIDLKRAHTTASPVDNLTFSLAGNSVSLRKGGTR